MKIPFLLLIFAAVILTGCGNQSSASNATANVGSDKTSYDLSDISKRSVAQSSTAAAPQEAGGGGGGQNSEKLPAISEDQARNSQNTPTERKIVRNAQLALESVSPEETQQKISAAVQSAAGFVIESQQSSSDRRSSTRDTVTMKVRVPADKFEGVVAEIRKTADRVIVETVKGEDVTEEFVDIEARLVAKRALEQQFMEIMKRANSVEDALNVQRQLAEVRGEIEQIEGRKRFLENQSSLSTISIEIRTPAAFSTNSEGFSYRLTEALSSGFDFALNFIFGLVSVLIALLPFFIFIVLPLFLIARYFWKRNQRRKTAAEIAEDELSNE